MNIEIIRTNGERESRTVPKSSLAACRKLVGADCFDVVNLRDGRVMLVDDTGLVDGKPLNAEATKLYHSICWPGTTAGIHGDVVIANDADFEG